MEPMAAVVAGAEPEMAPKNAEAPVLTCAKPPGYLGKTDQTVGDLGFSHNGAR